MTLDDAIRVIENDINVNVDCPGSALEEALNLGIEALKYVRSQYDPDHQMMRILLPGETLD